MTTAIIFDYFGVISPDGGKADQALLDYIAGLGKSYKTGLLTNMGAGGVDRVFPGGLAAKYFDVAVTSGDIGAIKPDVRAYEIIAEKLGVPLGECVMVDDRELCVTGAIEAGMQAILYVSLSDLKQKLAELVR
jgi:putative hydrolase of the HAD superfamily